MAYIKTKAYIYANETGKPGRAQRSIVGRVLSVPCSWSFAPLFFFVFAEIQLRRNRSGGFPVLYFLFASSVLSKPWVVVLSARLRTSWNTSAAERAFFMRAFYTFWIRTINVRSAKQQTVLFNSRHNIRRPTSRIHPTSEKKQRKQNLHLLRWSFLDRYFSDWLLKYIMSRLWHSLLDVILCYT